MRDSVAFFSGSLREYPTVSSFLLPLSGALEKYPSIRLTQVVWEAADDDKAIPLMTPSTPREAPPLKSAGKAGADAAPAAPRAPGVPLASPFTSGRHSVAVIEGAVTVRGVDFRTALAQVEGLVADIAKIPGYRAELLDSPLDLAPRSAIQGRLGSAPR